MSRRASSSSLMGRTVQQPSPSASSTISSTGSAAHQKPSSLPGSVVSSKSSASNIRREAAERRPSRTTSILQQPWPEEPLGLTPVASQTQTRPRPVGLESTPLPKAIIPKVSPAWHRAHVAKKYLSTKRCERIYGVGSGWELLQGTLSFKIIHARIYLFYARSGPAKHHIVDVADPEKNVGSYGFFQGDFGRLFESHFGISDGRARVVYREKDMPEPWMDVHLDIEIRKRMEDGKEQMQELALGLYKPIVPKSSKMEEMKRNNGKCGAWIEEAENEKRAEEERQIRAIRNKTHWRLLHKSRRQG